MNFCIENEITTVFRKINLTKGTILIIQSDERTPVQNTLHDTRRKKHEVYTRKAHTRKSSHNARYTIPGNTHTK